MKYSIFTLLLALSTVTFSQSSWHTLPTAPVADSFALRFDDIYFVNPTTGWVITTGFANVKRFAVPPGIGKIYRTDDGGTTWNIFYLNGPSYLRCIGFFDANTGMLGTLDSNHILYRTTNGGVNWSQVSDFSGIFQPLGVCGMSIVDSTTAYGVGRYWGRATVIKTTDKGETWSVLSVNGLANTLIDCKFWSPDSGLIVGGLHPNPYTLNGNAVILFTGDGGQTWQRVYRSNRTNEWCWKIFMVNRNLLFSSIEKESLPTNIVRSTNGGQNWTELPVSNSQISDLEGIGFLNQNTGWIGGWGYNFHLPTYATTNGGQTWSLAGWGVNMNRVRFLSDTLAYSVGLTVYKYTSEPIGINPVSSNVPAEFKLEQNFPNPFNPSTTIRFTVPKPSHVKVDIYDEIGRESAFLVNQLLQPGTYEQIWNATDFQSGIYFVRLEAEGYFESRKMILLK